MTLQGACGLRAGRRGLPVCILPGTRAAESWAAAGQALRVVEEEERRRRRRRWATCGLLTRI